MSTAAPAAAAAPAPAAKSKKKLIIIVAAVVLVLVIGAVAFLMLGKKKHAEEDGAEADHAPAHKEVKFDPKKAPIYVPLEPFTVNLADRDADRFAQIGVSLEIGDAKLGDQLKAYMPAVRNSILMAIADRSAADLMDRDGKTKLARRIAIETSRTLGYEVEDDEEEGDAAAHGDEKKPAKKKKKKKAAPDLPILGVHFSNFIVQ